MANGIKDKVVILGMGCSQVRRALGQARPSNLMVEAFDEAIADAGIEHQADRGRLARHRHRGAARRQVGDAAGGGAAAAIHSGHAGRELLRHRHRGLPRRGLCGRLRAPPTSRWRSACEKLKDTGYGGLPQRGRGPLNDMTGPNLSAPGSFAQLAAAYRAKHGVEPKRPEARHGARLGQEPRQRRQQPQGAPAQQDHDRHRAQRADRRRAAGPLRLLRRVATAPPAPSSPRRRSPAASARSDLVSVKALQLAVSNGLEAQHNSWDGSYLRSPPASPPSAAYAEAGIDRPARPDLA